MRKRKKRSQTELAEVLGVKRTSISGYENGTSEPPIKTLLKISSYFKIGTDSLLKEDLTTLAEFSLQQMERTYGTDLEGKKLRVLTTTVSQDEEENIELVPEKAKAGYTNGYADPEYIKVLSTFRMPFLDRQKKYRSFQISGDSMPPVNEGSWVTGEYVQNWKHIKDGVPYILVTKNDGIVFKVVYNKIEDRGTLLLCSTNPFYDPYEVAVSDILEVWKFTHYISNDLPEPNLPKETITNTVYELQREVKELKARMHNEGKLDL